MNINYRAWVFKENCHYCNFVKDTKQYIRLEDIEDIIDEEAE